MKPMSVLVAIPCAAVLTGCAGSSASTAAALDGKHIARVEQDARLHTKTVLWVNPPTLRGTPASTPGSAP